jgi:hypothetical protein
MSICLPATLVAVTIALATTAIALFVARHRHHRCLHPPHCRPRRRHRCLTATLVPITITLMVAVAVHSPAILVAITIAIALLPLPSLSPTTLIAVAIALAALTLSLFVIRQTHHRCRPYCHRHCPPPSTLSPLLLPPSQWPSLLPVTLIAVAIALFVAVVVACPPPLLPWPSPSLLPPPFMAIAIALLLPSGVCCNKLPAIMLKIYSNISLQYQCCRYIAYCNEQLCNNNILQFE